MKYCVTRGIENLEKMTFSGSSRYNLPIVPKMPIEEWHEVFEAPFNYYRSIRGAEARSRYLLHFFVDDYQFERVWQRPDYYLPGLQQYAFVVMPDFSTYFDFPFPIKLYNIYRNRWLGAYWAMNGVRVVPHTKWGDERTYDLSFDGMPIGGVYCVSSVGVNQNKEYEEIFVKGFNEFLRRLQPDLVLMYGNTYDGMTECNMRSLTRFSDEMEARASALY